MAATTPEMTRAIYVRMSDRLARKLDKAAERLGVSKRDVLSGLVNDHLDLDGDNLVVRLRTRPARRVAEEEVAPDPQEVLTLDEAAALLRVPTADVLALIHSAELPARHVGDQWRLARAAVLGWLAGGTASSAPR